MFNSQCLVLVSAYLTLIRLVADGQASSFSSLTSTPFNPDSSDAYLVAPIMNSKDLKASRGPLVY
jgi:hypothetical protein